MKKILVTGAAGFIGSHLVETLVKNGKKVIAYDRYNTFNNWGHLENSKFKNDFEMILGDIRDYDSVSKIMKNCDSVMHLAALIGIPYSYVSPLAYIKTNIEGTYNVLEASKANNINNIIITSTSETYGSALYTPMDENHRLLGQSPYSASKIAADNLSLSYYMSYNLPVKIIRPFNCYGPRQSARAIIPTIASQLLSSKKNIHLGNINSVRDLTYVEDLTAAFCVMHKSKNFIGEVTNVGTGKGYKIEELYKIISNKLNIDKNIIIEKKRIRPKNSEVDKLICDNKKIRKSSLWKPKINIEKGIENTVNWIKQNQEIFKSNTYNV